MALPVETVRDIEEAHVDMDPSGVLQEPDSASTYPVTVKRWPVQIELFSCMWHAKTPSFSHENVRPILISQAIF